MNDWVQQSLADLGDCVGRTVMLHCEYGSFKGGLVDITSTEIHIEVNRGQVVGIGRHVLEDDLTELYLLEVFE